MKFSSVFYTSNNNKNEINYLHNVLYDAGNFRRDKYCVILNS